MVRHNCMFTLSIDNPFDDHYPTDDDSMIVESQSPTTTPVIEGFPDESPSGLYSSSLPSNA
jgi:hypothetical protein